MTAPQIADQIEAQARLDDFLADTDLGPLETRVKDLLAAVADHSPYLWRLIRTDAARLKHLLATPPRESLSHCLETLTVACDAAADEAEAMRLLRRAKQEIALLVALADLGGVWDVEEVMAALTAAADIFVRSALRFVLRTNAGGRDPEENCGIVILALGKHGAGELNYSSDTDLIVLFDPDAGGADPQEAAQRAIAMTRRLVKLLQERTADGYVLRVDLRLRPDPGSTAIAIALPAAYGYYELYGQNWERAALIKARPIAGDRAVGAAFLARLTPFIWRKYLDYAAIADIHAMKRQIHAVRGHGEVAVAGHDVKLGRGGIREIEFFVQTQQLIYGGKKQELRGAQTLAMLAELAREHLVTESARDDLTSAYLFLREIEHRLQMIADEQTQRLPKDDGTLERFARFCGYDSLAAFAHVFAGHLSEVAEHYARLFERAPGLSSEIGDLVFTGVSDDPETLKTLTELGFKRPGLAAETIRGWHFGRHPAMQSERAREILTELVPALLQSFAQSGDPDAALAAFDAALGRMKAVTELLAILKSNAQLRDLFANSLGSAPRLAEMVVRRPHVLDAAIDVNRLDANLEAGTFSRRLAAQISAQANTEDFLDLLRDFQQEESFLIGLRLLADLISADDAGTGYSNLAEAVVEASLSHLLAVFAEKYGRVRGARCVILGLGKLGSREMTAASDLDLILLYDFDPDHPLADGPQALDAVRYFTMLTQRLISSLTVNTKRGLLYEVDLRLRPSGRKGPVATQFSSFRTYQLEEAASWEHLALTRARVIAGDAGLRSEVEAARTAILSRAPAPMLRTEVAEMRQLIGQEKHQRGTFDLKYGTGSLIDIDFIAQYLCLAHAQDDRAMLATNPTVMLKRAQQAGYISREQGETLLAARQLYTDVMQVLHTLIGPALTAPLNEGIDRRLAAAAGLPDRTRLEAEIAVARADVAAIFETIVGRPDAT
ncbi:MAG TPA: bifunctional [glutamine synthetase] adenylyltransferase/[glutamine synthetase]-adenylyl-L-tyrosine phosphorylase [Methylovirgula sp.]